MQFEQRNKEKNSLGKPKWRFKKCSFQIEMERVNSKMNPIEDRLGSAEINFDITKLREKG